MSKYAVRVTSRIAPRATIKANRRFVAAFFALAGIAVWIATGEFQHLRENNALMKPTVW